MRVWNEDNDLTNVQELRGNDGVKLRRKLLGRKNSVQLTEKTLERVLTEFGIDPNELNSVRPYTLGVREGNITFAPINPDSYAGPDRIFNVNFVYGGSSRIGFFRYLGKIFSKL